MRRKFECIYISPIDGEKTIGFVEAYFMENHDVDEQVKVYFSTRIAPINTLVSFIEY